MEKIDSANAQIVHLERLASDLHNASTSIHAAASDAIKRGSKALDTASKDLRKSSTDAAERHKLQAEVNRSKDQQKADKIINTTKEKEKKILASDLATLKRDLAAARKENEELRKSQREGCRVLHHVVKRFRRIRQ